MAHISSSSLVFSLAVVLIAGCNNPQDEPSSLWGGAKGENGGTTTPGYCETAKVLIVLDKSSSMVRNCLEGTTATWLNDASEQCPGASKKLWQLATEAVSKVVDKYQTDAEFGLVLFPQPTSTAKPNVKPHCTTGQIAVEPAVGNASKITSAFGEPPTYGGWYTPMADTLNAVKDLPSMLEGKKRHVVLVTDGSECCIDDLTGKCIPGLQKTPISAVEKLTLAGITTHVVGFSGGVDSGILNEMAKKGGAPVCSTANGGRCYYQADSFDQLDAALKEIVEKVTQEEICDGKDNNCNKLVDLADPNLKVPADNLCENQFGVCKGSVKQCLGADGWGCSKEMLKAIPGYEEFEKSCDGLDNDCDDDVDEGCPCKVGELQACGKDANCNVVQRLCKNGNWPDECPGAVKPLLVEKWDGKDNDCDGDIDEGFDCKFGADPKPCGKDVGECKSGVSTCVDGKWTACSAPLSMGIEGCDGKDNDCNGLLDDNLEPRKCALQVGVCYESYATCGGASGWKTCGETEYQKTASKYGVAYQKEETACDGKDNDCDGTIDEGCPCYDGQRGDCPAVPGVCEVGTWTCVNGVKGQCVGATSGIAEVCDNVDNNCDGQVDEGLTQSCNNQCGVGTAKCIRGQWLECDARTPTEEKCDGIDNDCDGQVDGPTVRCPNGGECVQGKCTERTSPLDYGMMAGGGISCAAGGGGNAAGSGLLLLLLLSVLMIRRRR